MLLSVKYTGKKIKKNRKKKRQFCQKIILFPISSYLQPMYECSFLGNTKSSFFLELKGLIKIVGSTNKIFKEILHKKKKVYFLTNIHNLSPTFYCIFSIIWKKECLGHFTRKSTDSLGFKRLGLGFCFGCGIPMSLAIHSMPVSRFPFFR